MLTEAILEMVKARLGVSVMQTWAIEPALRAGDVRAIPITAAGIRRQWHAATLEAAGRVAHVDAFIDLLARRAMPARRRPLRDPALRTGICPFRREKGVREAIVPRTEVMLRTPPDDGLDEVGRFLRPV